MNKQSWLDDYQFLIYESIDSTNLEIRRLYNSGLRKNVVLWAKTQTMGKGRGDKQWTSPPGNLYLTILLNQQFVIKDATNFSFLVAVALGETIDTLTHNNLNIHFKWPNDVLINGKKVAGILLETVDIFENKYISSLIIGVGCNLQHHPEGTTYGATDLKNCGYDIEIENFLNKFIESFEMNKNLLELKGFSVIRDKWLKRAFGLQEVVTVKTNNTRIVGIFQGINEEGRMIVELSNGQNCYVDSEELFFGKEINEHTR